MRRVALVVAAGLWLAPAAGLPADPPAETIGLPAYVTRLASLRALLDEGRLDEARAAGRDLQPARVVWAGETLAPDHTLLSAIAEARSDGEARAASRRLGRLLAALGSSTGAPAAPAARPELLARVAPRDPARRGGQVATLRVRPISFPERVEAALVAFADWVSSAYRRLFDWLESLKPRRESDAPTPGRTAAAAIAFALAVVLVLAVLVVRARRGHTADPDLAAEPIVSSRRDDDPTSRGSSDWERLAAELAGARRFREAIRAWYHAVLVTLFGAGLLHHQKGRTNWEYVSRLEPDLAWRPSFVALTRIFDREWYGRRASEAEALAECARSARGILRAVRGGENAP